jgi:hypothetical protein
MDSDLGASAHSSVERGGSPPGRASPAAFWRAALDAVCDRLEAEGLAPEEAVELAEAAVIACVLRYEPRSAREALALVLDEAGLGQATF